ncbi:zinc metalloproteinase nas-1-like isoform X2 [Clytia hemisphaerica]|uniref:zinc metalloproteinase nas-1-like isoform X2 n=1 Tax=Clytia hemisphaerica TaxID=252671 RepID=UPI0034D498A1
MARPSGLVVNEKDLFEGDIILTPEQKEGLRKARLLKLHGNKGFNNDQTAKLGLQAWPSAYVPYRLSPAIGNSTEAVKAIEEAAKYLSKWTCVNLYQLSPRKNKDYIYFETSSVCAAPLGYTKGKKRQSIGLSPKCYFYTYVMHLVIHALGYFHEHTRPDRDNYVITDYTRTLWPDVYKVYFEKFEPWMTDDTYNKTNADYDFLSIMHPPVDWFTIGPDTIQTPVYSALTNTKKGKNGFTPFFWSIKPRSQYSAYTYEMGQRYTLSYWDQRKIGFAYHCPYDMHGEFVNFPVVFPKNYKPDTSCYDLTGLCFEWKVRYNRCNKMHEGTLEARQTRQWCRRTCGLCTRTVVT